MTESGGFPSATESAFGFVKGFVICYLNLVDQTPFRGFSFDTLSTSLTKYLQEHPESQSLPAESSLLKVSMLLPKRKSFAKPDETASEMAAKRGTNNDGDEWRGVDTFQLGYIEGFLQCYSRHTKQEYGTFSKPPDWYVNAIADWYGTGPEPEESNPSRASEKIPELLFRLRDK